MRRAVRAGRVIMSNHAVKEMKEDGLTLDDVFNVILTGTIVEEQYDPQYRENKYIIYGDSLNDDEIGVVAKLGRNENTVVITVYSLTIEDYDY